MDRTYNVFVDNGLYVLGNYLEKDINDITIEDVKDSTKMFSEKFIEYEGCGYYKKNIDMGFHNSSYTQKIPKGVSKVQNVKKQYDLILDNIGEDEYCSICGKKHIKINCNKKFLSSFSRSLMPRLHSNTFINYINNLQIVNVCPICLYLSMISLFNFSKAGNAIVLYNSDSDEFMENYTYEMQIQVIQNLLSNTPERKEKISNFKYIEKTIENIIHDNKKGYDGYIQAISFYNGGQSELYKENLISDKDLKFIEKLENESLLSDFKFMGLFENLIEGQLQNNYMSYVFNYNDEKLKISEELFKEIEEEYSKLNKNKLELIENICEKVYKTNNKNEVLQLKDISNLSQFEKLLVKWNENYMEKTNNILFQLNEYDEMCDFKEFQSTKNRMSIEFMQIVNKNNKLNGGI